MRHCVTVEISLKLRSSFGSCTSREEKWTPTDPGIVLENFIYI